MKVKSFSVSLLIKSPPQIVYSIIADYHNLHPQILPKPPFVSLDVEQGGIGGGTVALVKMKIMGKLQSFRTIVTEPEPGRLLVETNDTGYITIFNVEPGNEGKYSYVTFTTQLAENSGLMKRLEFLLTKRLLIPVYKKELEKLGEISLRMSASG